MKHTYFESFTGTGAIAIVPGPYSVKNDEEDDEENDDNDISERIMTRRPVINEWEPAFSGGEYEPGDYQMPSPTGDGVAARKPKQSKVGSYDTATKNVGKEWPRKHKDTAAMCDVDENGVENKPQGGHKSSVGKPTDGHQSEVGHNWPDQPKNSGGGVAEPVEGTRWSDGGTLKGSGQDEFPTRRGSPGMPKEGPITGTSGPQLGQPQESSWNPQSIGRLIGEEIDLQSIFDSYARSTETICLEDFERLCLAHGAKVKLDETSILRLMHTNREYLFLEGEDANGVYWVATPLAEGKKPFPGAAPPFKSGGKGSWDGGEEGETEEGESETKEDCPEGSNNCSESRTRPNRALSEAQVRTPYREQQRFNPATLGGQPFGKSDGLGVDDPTDYDASAIKFGLNSPEIEGDPDFDPEYGERLSDWKAQDRQTGPGPYSSDFGSDYSCAECGYSGPEEECPECGAMMGGIGEDDLPGHPGWNREAEAGPDSDDYGDFDSEVADEMWDADEEYAERSPPSFSGGGPERLPQYGAGNFEDDEDFNESEEDEFSESREFNPRNHKAIREFLVSARNIIGRNQGASRNAIGEALSRSWQYYASNIDPRRAPSKVQNSLQELMGKFPGFSPLYESDAMEKPQGSAISNAGGGPKQKFLKDSPTDMKELGEPLGKKQKNNLDGTPVISGTEKGMSGSGAVKENIVKLSKHVKNTLQEAARGLNGKHKITFTCLVQECDGSLNRTGTRMKLAEALADAEELLQFNQTKRVVLEAYFMDGNNVKLKYNVPMINVKKHAPLREGNNLLFRFGRHAEHVASNLVAEGATCRVGKHNWGSSVKVLTERRK